MANLDELFEPNKEELYWMNKEISYWVNKTEAGANAESIVALMKNFPKNSKEDKELSADIPKEIAGIKIEGTAIKDLVNADHTFFDEFGRANKGSKIFIGILNGDDALAKKLLFGSTDGEGDITSLVGKAITSYEKNGGKVYRAEVWNELIPEIDDYVKQKAKEAAERKKAKAAEKKETKSAPKKAPKRKPKGKSRGRPSRK